MSRLRFAVVAIGILCLTQSALATSNRVFISTTGNNANDCSNPLTPCLDFGGALLQVNAGGEIIAEATGPYGPLNITKAVTISGPPGVVIYSGHQVTVNAPGATVVLRGLTIDGSGASENGIWVVEVGTLHVESCVITGFTTSSGSLNGIGIFFSQSGNLFIKDTSVRNNGYIGIWLYGAVTASIDRCRVESNQYGLLCDVGARGTVRNSVISGNGAVGVSGGYNAQVELNIEKCVTANNGAGIVAWHNSIVRVSNATITNNETGLSVATGGSILSRGNNTLEGNGTDGTFTGSYAAK